jgi:chromosome segregation ATPase
MIIKKYENEIESLQSQLQSQQQHLEQYRRMCTLSEASLKEITERYEAFKNQHNEEKENLKQALEAIQQELDNHRASSGTNLKRLLSRIICQLLG